MCEHTAVWLVEWSDREVWVCQEIKCKAKVVWMHDNDRKDDRTGMLWRRIGGGRDFYTPSKKRDRDEGSYPV